MTASKQQQLFTLGTVQLGLTYGLANQTGKPDDTAATFLLKQAIESGITTFDTARAYGEAERRIGNALQEVGETEITVITKLDPLDDLTPESAQKDVADRVQASVETSCKELQQSAIDTLLLHRWEHRSAFNGIIWKTLRQLQDDGKIKTLGVSVYTPDEAISALQDNTIGHIQLPFNLLDWRWQQAGIPTMARERKDIIIHARSVLLQGFLVTDLPIMARLKNIDAASWHRRLNMVSSQLNRQNRQDLCFAYVRAQDWIDSIVIGIETPAQMKENIALFQRPALSTKDCEFVELQLNNASTTLLNPALWQMKN